MNEKELKKLVNDFGFAPGNYKYIPLGSEILRYVGQVAVLVTFTRVEEELKEGEEKPKTHWEDKIDRATIISIYDHDPMTMTYMCKYKIDGNDEELEFRMQPEGYEFVNAEETGMFRRLVPYSLHCKMVEDEFFFARLEKLWSERDTLPFEALKTISESKDSAQVLRYSHNIGAAVRLENGQLIWMRIHELTLKHRSGNRYGLFFYNEKRQWSTQITTEDKIYSLNGIGDLKIIDLADIVEPPVVDGEENSN